MAGGVTNFANTLVKTDANGYLLVSIGGGTIAAASITALKADTVKLDIANADIVLWRQAAKTLQIDTDGAGGALTLTTVQGPLTVSTTMSAATAVLSGAISTYKGVATAGQGVPSIYAVGNIVGTTAAVPIVAKYTVPVGADGDFEVSAFVRTTVATTHSFSVKCTYTDESGAAQTAVLAFSFGAGTALDVAISAADGTAAYCGFPLHIRAKQTTVITVLTTGTLTTVTYNVRAAIRQLQ